MRGYIMEALPELIESSTCCVWKDLSNLLLLADLVCETISQSSHTYWFLTMKNSIVEDEKTERNSYS